MSRATPDTLTSKLAKLRDALLTGLVERDVAIRLALLAAVAGEHLLLVGPPGTAKSLVARRLNLAFADSTYFERLLTRFSVPEELFGPLSIKGLEQDRYERQTQGYLPTASVAFLDEIFKANSAILNSLLTLLNEREFDNGTKRERTPLIAAIGASNELPDGAELDALYDRFLLRLHVGPVSTVGFSQLLGNASEDPPIVADELRLNMAELGTIREQSKSVVVPAGVLGILEDLRKWCQAEDIPVSDRRWCKILKLLQVSASTNGYSEVSIWDCWLLQHCVWSKPEDRERVLDWYAERIGAWTPLDIEGTTAVAVAWERRFALDRDCRRPMTDIDGQPLYLDSTGTLRRDRYMRVTCHRENKPCYLAPPGYNDSNGVRIRDRSNGGQGFTYDQMDRFVSQDIFQGRFAVASHRTAYLSDRRNTITTTIENQPAMEPMRYTRLYVNKMRDQIQQVVDSLDCHLKWVLSQCEHPLVVGSGPLWIPAGFMKEMTARLMAGHQTVSELRSRLVQIRHLYFWVLPREVAVEQSFYELLRVAN